MSQLLFVTAEAGGGKSTTIRTLVDGLEALHEPPLVAYFFFKDDDNRSCSYDEALSTLTYQLLVQDRDLVKHAARAHQQYGDALRHQTKEMWKIILQIASEATRDVFCVLDAVDECATSDRQQLVVDLVEIFHDDNQALLTSRLKFVVTSRPYEDQYHPYQRLKASSFIKILSGENAHVVSDIRNVILFKAEELAKKRELSQDIQDLLVSRLLDRNLRTRSFLAVRMTFELLDSHHMMHKGAGKRTIEISLAKIPQQLSDQFNEMLDRSHDRLHTWRLFCVILTTRRTLKISEFKVIYYLTQPASSKVATVESYNDLELPTDDEEFKRLVRSRCGLFITFIRNSVHLFHQTAREYLLARMGLPGDDLQSITPQVWAEEGEDDSERRGRSWMSCISNEDANLVCLRVCLDILTFTASKAWIQEV